MAIARLLVTGDVLRAGILLPQGTAIIGSEQSSLGAVALVIEHDSIPLDAEEVSAVCRSIHGVGVFDHFEVITRRDLAA